MKKSTGKTGQARGKQKPEKRRTGGERKAAKRGKTGSVRIIAGSYRRTQLPVLEAGGLRPTPDRVRETLFNWLGQSLQGWVCIDAFAGTGALGFEAASRGAKAVYLLETNTEVAEQLRVCRDRLDARAVSIVPGTASQRMGHLFMAGVRADLVFLDPPFTMPELLWSALEDCQKLLLPDGLVYVELSVKLRAQLEQWAEQGGWQVVRSAVAGADFFALLQRAEQKENG